MKAFRSITALAGLLVAAAAAADPVVPAALAALWEAKGDHVLQRALVPDPARPVGEVRLVQRGEAAVVQTLLYTRILERVVTEIAKKEESNWPAGTVGHEDAAAYVRALGEAREQVSSSTPRRDPRERPRMHLLVEFALDRTSAAVFLSSFTMEEKDGDTRILERTPIRTLPLSRDYVRRNMRLILADNLHVAEGDVPGLSRSLAGLLTDP